jgi:hypothetical protein
MAKRRTTKQPIMTPDLERFMALEGLVQWTSAAIMQADRLANATIAIGATPEEFRLSAAARRTEADLFVATAWKVLEFRKWVRSLGVCATVDFSEIDKFDATHTRDLRNMREHVVNYFQGRGKRQQRWLIETPEYKADASSMSGDMIGGRLDYKSFAQAAKALLPQLLKEPLPKT